MKLILGSVLLGAAILSLAPMCVWILPFGSEFDLQQGGAVIQERLPQLQEMASDAMRPLGMGIKVVFRWIQQEFDACAQDGTGIATQLCQSLQEAVGEEQAGWWSVIRPVLEKVENFFR